ncbi:MAG: flagellar protein FlgN [bacterium]
MAPPTKELLQLLEQITSNFEKLVTAARKKQDALMERDIDRLEEINEAESALSGQIQKQRDQTEELWQNILDTDVERLELSMEQVIDEVPERYRDELRDVRQELETATRELQSVTRENILLLENRLDVYDELFDAMSDENKDERYGRDRQEKQERINSPMMIDEAI